MSIAIRKALKVLETYGLSSSFVDFKHITTIIDNENIILYAFPFRGRLKERYICTGDGIAQIAIKKGVELPDAKHLTAHALGHHFLHRGNYAFIDSIVLDKQEKQAEDFAAVLLVPPRSLNLTKPVTARHLAYECQIPLHVAERRLRIYKNHGL